MNKFLSVLIIIVSLTTGYFIFDIMFENIDVDSSDILDIFVHNKEEDIYTTNNLFLFEPREVKGVLELVNEYPMPIGYTKLLQSSYLVNIPIPNSSVYNNLSDLAFDKSGEYYIAMSKISEEAEEDYCRVVSLGYNKPKVVEFRFKGTDCVIYIQCYTNEMLSFFTDKSVINSIILIKTEYDYSKDFDTIATMVSYPDEIKSTQDYLDEESIEVIEEVFSELEFGDVLYKGDTNSICMFFKAIGSLDFRMRVEYSRLLELGLEPVAMGMQDGISYIKFNDEVYIVGAPININSCNIGMIQYVKEGGI